MDPDLWRSVRRAILRGADQVHAGTLLRRSEEDSEFWNVSELRSGPENVHRQQVRAFGDEGSSVPCFLSMHLEDKLENTYPHGAQQERIPNDL